MFSNTLTDNGHIIYLHLTLFLSISRKIVWDFRHFCLEICRKGGMEDTSEMLEMGLFFYFYHTIAILCMPIDELLSWDLFSNSLGNNKKRSIIPLVLLFGIKNAQNPLFIHKNHPTRVIIKTLILKYNTYCLTAVRTILGGCLPCQT